MSQPNTVQALDIVFYDDCPGRVHGVNATESSPYSTLEVLWFLTGKVMDVRESDVMTLTEWVAFHDELLAETTDQTLPTPTSYLDPDPRYDRSGRD